MENWRAKCMLIFGIGGLMAGLFIFNQNLIMPGGVESKVFVSIEKNQYAPILALPEKPYTLPEIKPKEQPVFNNNDFSQGFLHINIYNYLSVAENRQNVLEKTLNLNNGQYVNACVYFVSETLRQNSIEIPNTTCKTSELITLLENLNWTCITDYKTLLPGDICFTTDEHDINGTPTHTYIFMGWVLPDSFDYAMVCDNQADRYGAIYHNRNITIIDVYKGEKKEAFQFFMREDNILCGSGY
jgi:hypothetical protein